MGILGTPIMGGLQDKGIDADLKANHPEIHQKIVSAPRSVPFIGQVPGFDEDKVTELSEDERKIVTETRYPHKKRAFFTVAVLPAFMLICYIIMFLYFKSRGGYKAVELDGGESASAH